MEKKVYFKFEDNSVALLPINHKFRDKPIEQYTSDRMGFGEWIKCE